MPSINQQLNALSADPDARALRPLFEAILAQNAALTTAYNNLLAKLDDDSGVDDTDYESTLAVADPTLTE